MPQVTLLSYFNSVQPDLSTSSSYPVELNLPSTQVPATQAFTHASHEGVSMCVETPVVIDNLEQADLDFFVPQNQSQAAIVKVKPPYVVKLKNITNTLLPVRYPDKFFSETVTDDTTSNLSRVLLWAEQPVGWIRCRLEDDDRGYKHIYIQALGLLAPYRGCGLATCLLDQVVRSANLHQYGATTIYCHVWESNQDAVEWYEKRGFSRQVLLQQYYRKLRPAGAWIMRRTLDLA